MSATLILGHPETLAKAQNWLRIARPGTRVTFEQPRRSLDQNSRMWAMLSEVAEQASHMGRKYTKEQWKAIFMHALGHQIEFIPSLDGSTFIPYSGRSSKLSVKEMCDLQELIMAEGLQRGVAFRAVEYERAA